MVSIAFLQPAVIEKKYTQIVSDLKRKLLAAGHIVTNNVNINNSTNFDLYIVPYPLFDTSEGVQDFVLRKKWVTIDLKPHYQKTRKAMSNYGALYYLGPKDNFYQQILQQIKWNCS